MKVPYHTHNPESGVANYEIVDGAIILEFVGSKHRYVYDMSKPGPIHLQEMYRLATSGRGLATYVSQQVHNNYAAKIRIDTLPA